MEDDNYSCTCFARPAFLAHRVRAASDDAASGMIDFAEPTFEEKTNALKRDFENREFIGDLSLSVQQLAAFISNFGVYLVFEALHTTYCSIITFVVNLS